VCNLRRLEMKRRIIQGIKSQTRSSLKTPYREDNDFVEADEVTDLVSIHGFYLFVKMPENKE